MKLSKIFLGWFSLSFFLFMHISCKDKFKDPEVGVVIIEFYIPTTLAEHDQNAIRNFASINVQGAAPTGYPDGQVDYAQEDYMIVRIARLDDSNLNDNLNSAKKWLDSSGYNSVIIKINRACP